jgi:outer membrane receptor protein involved in Fe transport
MITHKRIQLTKLALALSIALAAAPSFAQNTTSAIGGRISGPDGKPAGGASVSIVHTESGSVSTVVTDAEGRYVARGLRTGGPYTITITKNGITEKREGVFTQLAETAAVDATLGAPIQSVTVTGSTARSEKFSRTTMGTGTSIGATELATQASIQRSLQDYARADPRVSQTDKERGDMSVAGQNSRYNSMTIDGVAVNDTFGIESTGTPTLRQPISIEAIQSVQVNIANYDVTQKAYTGGNINAVTKSGTNDWKGGVYYVYRDDRLAGKRYNSTNDTYYDPVPFKETTKGVWASGPLVQDKLFIYALTEEFKSTRSAAAFGPVGAKETNVAITPAAIAAAQAIAKNTYGLDIGDLPKPYELVMREQSIKLDWNISDNHRANLRFGKTTQAEPFFPFISATGLTLDSMVYNQSKSFETLVGQVFSDWTPTFSTEFKASRRAYDSVPINNTRLPLIGLAFSGPFPAGTPAGVQSGTRNLNFGTENNRHVNVLSTDTQDWYAGANWSLGDHEVKFGTDYNRNRIYNLFLANANGNYTFGCVNSSATYLYSSAVGSVNCTSSSQATIEAAVLENFRIGRPNSYTLATPVAGVALDDIVANFTLKNTGLFLQDTWSVNPALTLTYGVRVDKAKVDGKPRANAAAAQPMVAGFISPTGTFVRQTGGFGLDNTQTIDGQQLVQPRFGFNYKLPTTLAMQLRGGAGLFQGAAANVWMSNPFSNPGVSTRTISCSTSTTNCPSTEGLFSANPGTQPTNVGGPAAADVDFLDPSVRQPSIMKANLAFDAELPWYNLVVGAEFLYNKNKDSIYYEHLNLGAPTKIGPDGRNMYYNANGLDSTKFTYNSTTGAVVTSGVSNKALANSAYRNVLVAKKTDQGDGKVLTLSLSRPLTKGFGWSVAYSRTDATEVSPLSNSIANSNYNARAVFNPNESVAENSSYLVKDRVNMLVNFQKKIFAGYNTRFGLFYEGRSGKPYSWIINNDLNGDGLTNDLMFIPKAAGSGEVLFYGDTATSHVNEDKFWAVVNGDKDLRNAAGGVTRRNGSFAPWTNSFDLRISQEIPGLFGRNKASFALDFMNVGNMFNKKWGRINEVLFQAQGGSARSFVDYVGLDKATGKYVYAVRPQVENVDIRQAKGESQWAIQGTFKYEF